MEELTQEQLKAIEEQTRMYLRADEFIQSILEYASHLDVKPTKLTLDNLAQVQTYLQGFYFLNMREGNIDKAAHCLLSGVVAAYILGLIQDKPESKENEILQ